VQYFTVLIKMADVDTANAFEKISERFGWGPLAGEAQDVHIVQLSRVHADYTSIAKVLAWARQAITRARAAAHATQDVASVDTQDENGETQARRSLPSASWSDFDKVYRMQKARALLDTHSALQLAGDGLLECVPESSTEGTWDATTPMSNSTIQDTASDLKGAIQMYASPMQFTPQFNESDMPDMPVGFKDVGIVLYFSRYLANQIGLCIENVQKAFGRMHEIAEDFESAEQSVSDSITPSTMLPNVYSAHHDVLTTIEDLVQLEAQWDWMNGSACPSSTDQESLTCVLRDVVGAYRQEVQEVLQTYNAKQAVTAIEQVRPCAAAMPVFIRHTASTLCTIIDCQGNRGVM